MIADFSSSHSGLVNSLRKGQLLALRGRSRGARIESRRGAIWITQDGDLNDVVLNPGEAHVLDSDEPVLIQALDAACVTVRMREEAERPGRLAGLWWHLRAAMGWRQVPGRAG
jgi:hypothetical protein